MASNAYRHGQGQEPLAKQTFHEDESRYQTLYEWEKKTRQVLHSIRQSVDTDEAFPIAIAEMAKALNADRAFIIEFDDQVVCPIRHEFRSTETVKPFKGILPPWDFCPFLARSAKNEMAWSADTYDDHEFAGNLQWHAFSRHYSIRSIVVAPILYKKELRNVVVFHILEPKYWNEHELGFIKVLTDELSGIFYEEKVRQELVNVAEFKNEFASKVSHELRTPLTSILSYARMVEKELAGPLTDKQAQYIQNVTKCGEHLLQVITNILDSSKLEAGLMVVAPEPVNMQELINEVRLMLESKAKAKKLDLQFSVSSSIDTVEADPSRMKQILLNLIQNAIKFTPAGGKVHTRLTVKDGWLIGQVQDNGIGIPKQKLTELFHRFHQIDSSHSRQHEGTGLGLALTKKFIELHGGDIIVESEEGAGTTFTFMMPVQFAYTQSAVRQTEIEMSETSL